MSSAYLAVALIFVVALCCVQGVIIALLRADLRRAQAALMDEWSDLP